MLGQSKHSQEYFKYMVQILAFDIGIKNLAWCCLQKNGTQWKMLGWDNYNLLSESSNVDVKKKCCTACSAKGMYDLSGQLYCGRHCPLIRPALRDLSGTLLKKIPKLELCKQLLSAKGVTKVPAKKAAILQVLETVYTFPVQEAKVSKAPDAGLTDIHNSLQTLVRANSDMWSNCTTILLENQPAFKNPTMKSVQMLLFATLRDLLPTKPPIRLVHAGKKVQGAAKGDAGYKERKSGSEARATAFLEQATLETAAHWKAVYTKAAKKSDLADALAMCIDAVPSADA
jgi:hypothetical protein